MMIAIDYFIHNARVNISSLIHDGVLIDMSDKAKVNLEALGERAMATAGLESSHATSREGSRMEGHNP